MSWLSENVFDPIENVGNAIFHGDITGGQYQASGSDWGKAALDVGALALGGVGAAGLGGIGPAAGLFGAGEGAAAAGGFDALAASGGAGLPLEGDMLAATGGAGLPQVGGSLADLGLNASPEALGSFASADPAAAGGTLNLGNLGGGTGGLTNVADAAGGSGGSGGGGIWDTLTSPSKWTLGGVAQGAGAGIAGLGLAGNLLKGNSKSAAEDRMTNMAAANTGQFQMLTAEGRQLRQYLETGTLPAAQQAAVDQALKAEKARIIAGAAKQGGSTDPTQNTALAQDLAAAERNALIMAGQLEQQLFAAGQQLLTNGLQVAQLSGNIYNMLANMDRQDTAELNKSIASFAASLAPKSSYSLNLGGAKAV